jgi:hypothetical protein
MRGGNLDAWAGKRGTPCQIARMVSKAHSNQITLFPSRPRLKNGRCFATPPQHVWCPEPGTRRATAIKIRCPRTRTHLPTQRTLSFGSDACLVRSRRAALAFPRFTVTVFRSSSCAEIVLATHTYYFLELVVRGVRGKAREGH